MWKRNLLERVMVGSVFIKICIGVMFLHDNQKCEYNIQVGRVCVLSDAIFIIGVYFSHKISLCFNSSLLFIIWLMSLIVVTVNYNPSCIDIDLFSVIYAFIGLIVEPTYIMILIEKYKFIKEQDRNLRLQLAQEDIL